MRNILLTLIALVLASCGGEMPSAASPATANLTPPEFAWEKDAPVSGVVEPTQPVSGNVSAPFDIGGVMRQVHFAFREKDGLFEGGDTNYAVKVTQDGSFSVTPVHYPNGKRDMARAERRDPREEMERMEHREREKPMMGKAASFRTLGFPVPRMRTNDKAHLELVRGDVVEELKNTENGVEQNWRFAKKPETTGDLTISVAVDGVDYIGATDNGLHFAEKGSKLGFRYGIGTWIDANGVETTIVPQWRHGMISLTVPRSVIEGSAYPAILDPVIGPEFGMDEPVWAPALEKHDHPAVSFDGTNYLVVWEDYRNDLLYPDIYGTRISTTGAVLDISGIAISTTEKRQLYPAIAFDGTNYLVIWQDERNINEDIYGTRVSTAGIVLEPEGIAISVASNYQEYPELAFDGINYFAVWMDKRNGTNYDIYGTRISTEGSVVDTNGVAVRIEPYDQKYPKIAFDGVNYFVVWENLRTDGSYSDIYGARVSTAGELIDVNGIAISSVGGSEDFPALAFDGTNYLVVWSGLYIHENIGGRRVSTAGIVLDTENIIIGNSLKSQYCPEISFDGINYLVAWIDARNDDDLDNHDVYGARVSTSGAVLDTDGVAISTAPYDQEYPAIACDGVNCFVVWTDYRNDNYSAIHGSRVSTAGNLIDTGGLAVSTTANNQQKPAISFDGTNYLVVWKDGRNGIDYDIYGARLSATGSLLDANGIAISTAPFDQTSPSIAFDGANYFVVWEDYRYKKSPYRYSDIYGARVTTDGSVLDLGGIAISNENYHQSVPALAFDGINYLVVWMDGRTGSSDVNIYGARVSTAGTVLNTHGFPINIEVQEQGYPAIVFDGNNYFVAWRDLRSNNDSDIYGTRVSTSGMVLDGIWDGIAISTKVLWQSGPAIAFDGNNYFVVWSDNRNGWLSDDIYGARISTAGVVLDIDGILISSSSGSQYNPAIIFDGVNHLVVWEDQRAGAKNYNIYGQKVSQGGLLLGSEMLLSADQQNEVAPAVSQFANNKALLVYSHYDDAPEMLTGRVMARFIYYLQVGENCAGNEQCLNGQCVDGVCCKSTTCDDGNLCTVDSCAVNGDGTCSNLPGNVGLRCRDAAGSCDVPDYCNGVSTECEDIKEPATVECRTAKGVCDTAEFCDEVNNDCPADVKLSSECRPAVDICDVVEKCDGVNDDCPPDVLVDATVECRAAAGSCDVAEYCTGAGVDCPLDLYAVVDTECRAKTGDCDVAESCTGSEINCPADAVALATVECRAQGGVCDVAENCDGKKKECPTDGFKTSSTECRASTDSCDIAEQCTGFLPSCPEDGVALATVECRAKDGDCDVAENCDGTSKSCPIDVRVANTVACRASADVCDVTEYCDGTNKDCPTDMKLTSECRPAIGVCDAVENCDGVNDDCPNDELLTNTTPCRTSTGDCDTTEYCTGLDIFCPAEDFTGVNGNVCDDANALTENDICLNGTCAGELIFGVCGNTIAIDALPYTATGTTIGRPNALNAYGAACGNAGKPSPDIIYALTVEAGVEYLIEVAPEASYDVTINLIGACQNNEVCLGVANGGGEGDAEAIIYSSASPRTIYIALEGSVKNEVGFYEIRVTTVEEPDDTPLPDIDMTVEPDDTTVEPDNDTVEPTDDMMTDDIQPDEAIVDDAVIPDEDTWVHEPPPWGADDIVYPEYDHTATDDAMPQDEDTVAADADAFQPDETVDESIDEATDESVDNAIEDIDSVMPDLSDAEGPDEQSPFDADTTKPTGNGCGCSLAF